MPPAISVVIPLYNKRDYIERCLKSVFAQTYEDYEVIVVNDGSSDGSGEVAEAMVRPCDTVSHQENAGASAARDRGWELAKGNLMAFLDADDEWLPEHLATLVELSERFPDAGLLAAGYRVIGQQGLVMETTVEGEHGILIEDYFQYAYSGNFVSMSGCAVPKRVLQRIGGFRTTPYQCEDTDLEVRIALEYPLAYHPDITSIYHTEAQGRAIMNQDWWPEPPPHVELLMERQSNGQIPTQLQKAAREFAANRLFAHAADGVGIKGKRAAVLELLDNPSLHNTRMSRQVKKLQLALRILPPSLIRWYLRIRSSRLCLPALQVTNGVKTQVVSRFNSATGSGKASHLSS